MKHSTANLARRDLLGLAAALAMPGLCSAAVADEGSISAQNFGIDPLGLKDSTDALEAALANTRLNGHPSNAGRVLHVPKGVYIVSRKLTIGSGQRIFFEPGVRIDATRLPTETTSLFEAAGQTDIELTGNGAELIGSRARARAEVEGNQAAIFIYGSTNVVVRDFKIRDFATDGITVSGEAANNRPSRNVRIENCEVRNCRRNGLSIIYCDGCVVSGGTYAASNGAPHGPWAGIDVEPNVNQQVIGVRLIDVHTQDNAGPGLLFVPGASSARPDSRFDVVVTGGGSHDDGSVDGLPAVHFACGGRMVNAVAGQVSVSKFSIDSPKSSGVSFSNWDADKAPVALLEDVKVVDPDGTANAHSNETRTGFVIYADRHQAMPALGNIRLVRCSAEDRRANPRMVRGGIVAADPGKSVRNVTVLDFSALHSLARLKYDFSTLASEVPGGMVDVTIGYSHQAPVDADTSMPLDEMGGRNVRAVRSGLRFRLPPAANCRGLSMIVSAAPSVQNTTIDADGGDHIQPAKGSAEREFVVPAGQLVTLKSDGGASWVEQ